MASTVYCTTTGCTVNGVPVQVPSNGIIHITCVNGQCSVDNQVIGETSNSTPQKQSTQTGLIIGLAITIALLLLGVGIFFVMNKSKSSPLRSAGINFRNSGGNVGL